MGGHLLNEKKRGGSSKEFKAEMEKAASKIE